jgi:hypothetical protein
MFRFWVALALPVALAGAARAGMVINEVAFDEVTGSPDWVELLNAGTAPVSLDGWTLTDHDTAVGNEIALSLSTPVPAGAYLTVYVESLGSDDTDFSDGAGALHAGTVPTVNLAATEDEAGLYSSSTSLTPATLVDFTAWVTDGQYDGAVDASTAVAAGQWPVGVAVPLTDTGSGYSLGRVADGADSDGLGDWRAYPRSTPGGSNTPPVSAPTASVLTASPDSNPFSPVDPDPARRAVRLLFNTGQTDGFKTLRIFDARGRLRRVLINTNQGPSGQSFEGLAAGAVDWDGRGDDGTFLPPGAYAAHVESTDPAGNRVQGRAVAVIGGAW